ncbi:MAG TPA: hypothetical protein DDW49_03675 [Deltaproteobacteria bacterium]|nr:MAG: hypothetical protein A2048_09325 [Deltaproteobacteria bacterium GWA2_45_12]HBF12480.1 hypothetical protein [Deltaproteobacteria bacterium]
MSELMTQLDETIKNIQNNVHFKTIRRGIIFLFGCLILLTGMVMIFLPGPSILVIPLGLTILASEFVWAKKLLGHFKNGTHKLGKILTHSTASGSQALNREIEEAGKINGQK